MHSTDIGITILIPASTHREERLQNVIDEFSTELSVHFTDTGITILIPTSTDTQIHEDCRKALLVFSESFHLSLLIHTLFICHYPGYSAWLNGLTDDLIYPAHISRSVWCATKHLLCPSIPAICFYRHGQLLSTGLVHLIVRS